MREMMLAVARYAVAFACCLAFIWGMDEAFMSIHPPYAAYRDAATRCVLAALMAFIAVMFSPPRRVNACRTD